MWVHHVTGDLLNNEPNCIENDDRRKQIASLAQWLNFENADGGLTVSEIYFEEESDSQFSIVGMIFGDGRKDSFFGLDFTLGYLYGLWHGVIDTKREYKHK